MELNFVKPPHLECLWVIYPRVMIGYITDDERCDLAEVFNLGRCISWKTPLRSEEIEEVVELIVYDLKIGDNVYIDDRKNRAGLYITCFVQAWFRWDLPRAEQYMSTVLKPFQYRYQGYSIIDRNMLKAYRRPKVVIICGDRNSSICFEEVIIFELKQLPRFSTIVHGGCKGVDLYAADLAQLRSLNVKQYSADWEEFGISAGPIRNREMLEKEKPDMVIAFHPDIEASAGTKDMMTIAWKAGVPVYLHDLKRKMVFNGDFSIL